MEKDKLKKYAWHALFGILGALLSWGILSIKPLTWEIRLYGWTGRIILPGILFILTVLVTCMLFGIPGGLIGGIMSKKWWGAFLGGFILNFPIVILVVNNYHRLLT
jgi:hypothetical protein